MSLPSPSSVQLHGAVRVLVEQVLGEKIPAGSDSISLVFERPLPPWGWFLFVVGAVCLALWCYKGLGGVIGKGRELSWRGTVWPLTLALCRTLTFVVVGFLLVGPSLRFERRSIEQDRLTVLLDRSQSLSIQDAPFNTTRESQLRSVLESAEPVLRDVAKTKQVEFIGFASGSFSLKRDGEVWRPILGDANGTRTNIDSALRQAIAQAAGQPLSAILLVSDGRSAVPLSGDTLRALERDAIPVHTIALGSAERLGDAAIVATSSPARAFVRDRVPIEVRVERGDLSDPLAVQLVEKSTGAVLTRVDVPSGTGEQTVVLDVSGQESGARTWKVELVRGDSAGVHRDLVPENDTREFAIELIDRPIRLLYVEGASRWEYRYLKNLLMREKDIESSVMLLSADRDFAQEGNMPISRLPRTKEEFSRYDLFILGDVPSGFFSPDQLAILRDEIAERGAGLLWIAGERSTPASWESTPLADLLPIKSPLALQPRRGESRVSPTPVAARLGVLRLSEDEDGWPDAFSERGLRWPALRYIQSISKTQLKPATEVLAMAEPSNARGEDASPAVLRMRFGAGDVVFVATDEIWRWRYGQGERYPERFWIPIVRMLARESLATGDARAELVVTPARVLPGESVIVSLRIFDEASIASTPKSVPVDILDSQGKSVGRLDLVRDGADASAVLPVDEEGSFVAVAEDTAFGRTDGAFEVVRRDEELRRGDTDHALLAEISQRTGGLSWTVDSLADLPKHLPLRAREVDESVERPIWDSGLAFLTLLVLLGLEWSARRVLRLA